MDNIKKLGRLWPLFIIIIISAVVFFLSLKTILFSDDSEPVSVTISETSSTSNVSTPTLTPIPTLIPDVAATPPYTPQATEIPSPTSPVPTQTAVPSTSEPEADGSGKNSPSEVQSTPETAQNVIIDNTVHEYSSNYAHTEEGQNNESEIASQIIRLVNQERNNYGLNGLSYDANLAYVASIRAMEISNSFSHTRPNGLDCFSAFPNGYIFMGENLASADGIISDSDFSSGCVKWWMESEGHRENILNGNYTNTAVGVYISGGSMYAVQLFGTPQ